MANRLGGAVLDRECAISMYRDFGAVVDHVNQTVQFRLFFPDARLSGEQYSHEAGLPEIKEIRIVGDFQEKLAKSKNWQPEDAPMMRKPVKFPPDKPKGWLYQSEEIKLPEGFYQYKYYITHDGDSWDENRDGKYKNDPCTKYYNYRNGHDNSAFVIGGSLKQAEPIENRLPLNDLIIYEVMLDDYVRLYNRDDEAFLETFMRDIDRIKSLGVNAVELMPWTAWPGGGFNWGYMPFLFFSVTNTYTENRKNPLDKLALLSKLISKLHDNDIHVIMDGVFDHVCPEFPYYQMYKNKEMCPYTGSYGPGGYGIDLDFHNGCTQEFILEVCKYWIDEFKIDGIRFDYTLGFYSENDPNHGITKLIRDLTAYVNEKNEQNICFILEHLTDDRYHAIDDTNRIGATGSWFDPYMWRTYDFLRDRRVGPEIMRILNSSKDFREGVFPVTYIENHDHSTIIGKMIECGYQGSDWAKSQPYAIALLTSPGAPMINNGQEYGKMMMMPEPFHEEEWGVNRVTSRPIDWEALMADPDGQRLFWLYSTLIWIRKSRPGLRSWHVYPEEPASELNEMGYGFDEEKQVVIYHRWGDDGNGETEYFIVALNFADETRTVDIPFPFSGTWYELLNEEQPVDIVDCWLKRHEIPGNWGRVFVGRS